MKSKFKSAVSLTLALLMTFSLAASFFVSAEPLSHKQSETQQIDLPFTDVKQDAWYYENVQYIYANEIMQGTSETKFEPDSPMTRGMGTMVLFRIAEAPDDDGRDNPFIDSAGYGLWFRQSVTWAYECKIVNGRTENKFFPNENIKRAEFAAMLYRYSKYFSLKLAETKNGSVTDKDAIPSYAVEAVDLMYKADVIRGRDSGIFDPEANITRAEAAAMLERFLKNSEYDPDMSIDIIFTSDSIGKTGNTPDHLRALAEGNHLIRVNEFVFFGTFIDQRIGFIKNKLNDYYTRIVKESELVIFGEGGAFLPAVDDERYRDLTVDYYSDYDSVEELRKVFGRDKDYYSFVRGEGPIKYAPDWVADIDMNPDTYIKRTNNIYKELTKVYGDHGLSVVYIPFLSNYNRNLDEQDFLGDDNYHPNDLAGYCYALALYCTIFNEKAADQNNGALKPHMIPGGTQEEKDEYMVILKDTIQEILDAQKID